MTLLNKIRPKADSEAQKSTKFIKFSKKVVRYLNRHVLRSGNTLGFKVILEQIVLIAARKRPPTEFSHLEYTDPNHDIINR